MHSVARGKAINRILPIGSPARLADAVGAVVDAGQRPVDLVELVRSLLRTVSSWSRSKLVAPMSALVLAGAVTRVAHQPGELRGLRPDEAEAVLALLVQPP
jgi:hypothetical protein